MSSSKRSTVMGFALLAAGLAFPLGASALGECEASCPGAASDKVVVDVAGMCMCVGEDDCFKVDIGKDGPQMTDEGAPDDKLEGCQGGKYQAKDRPNNGYDNDCLKMGIPGNDGVGKWIHKTSACHPGGNRATLGCIAVPCEHWTDLVEKAKGKMSLVVCNGGKNGGTSRSRSGSGSGYSSETQDSRAPSIGDEGMQ